MGSSETGLGGVDCSVGSIVWVRRRNGSWWPGKILGSDELSASHLMSPRSGTPVKLLGREDASVDWYNLEKSKRVKVFRCGEFDECISRAEASRGMPPKKREKYARREDAILHALELERLLLQKKYGSKLTNEILSSDPPLGGKESQYLQRGPCEMNHIIPPPPYSSGNNPEVTMNANYESSVFKRHDKHLPLSHVLQNSAQISYAQSRYDYVKPEAADKRLLHSHSAKLEIPSSKLDLYGDGDVDEEEDTSDSAEDTETDSSEAETTESDTDEDMSAALSDGGGYIGLEPKYPERMGSGGLYMESEEYGSSSSEEEIDELSLTDDTCDDSYYEEGRLFKRSSNSYIKRCDERKRKRKRDCIYSRDNKSNMTDRRLRPRSGGYGYRGFNGFNLEDSEEEEDSEKEEEEDSEEEEEEELMLIDVDVKVQASYERRAVVPLISLTSEYNGHAIVGHPIQIECVVDNDNHHQTLPPVWRTARRTANSRVPRHHQTSSSSGAIAIAMDDNNNDRYYYNKMMPPPHPLPLHLPHPLQKVSSVMSSCNHQKIRTLSSIIPQPVPQQQQEQEQEQEQKAAVNNHHVARGVACIPVKLVFTRLHEELVSRHQS